MPEKIYEIGYVYKIITPNSNLCYIGSTHKKLCTRLSQHEWEYKNAHKRNNISSIQLMGLGNCQIVEMERHLNITLKELKKYEDDIMKITPNKINKRRSALTEEEKKEYRKEYRKNYYLLNKI